MAARRTQGGFLERTRGARKVMVLDLGFIGDTVHTLPALWLVRQAYAQAELHMAVADHVVSLLECVPWVERAWGYPRFPRHATLRQNLQMIARLRRERFDVVINLNGSDRSSWLTLFSGAPERLGRLPRDGGPVFWRRMFTEFVEHSSLDESSFVQKCRCLEKAGFPSRAPEFHVAINPAHLEGAGLTAADSGRYLHLSPFTTAENKELPPEQLVELIHQLEIEFPEKRLVISGAPTERERAKLAALVTALGHKPWRVFAGDLSLAQLAAVVQHSAVNLSGDTGTLHLALMSSTPAVSWFLPNPGMRMWIPVGTKYRTVVGTIAAGAKFLTGVSTSDVVQGVKSVLGTSASQLSPQSPESASRQV